MKSARFSKFVPVTILELAVLGFYFGVYIRIQIAKRCKLIFFVSNARKTDLSEKYQETEIVGNVE